MLDHHDERWSSLIPLELLERILKRLTCALDCIRFGAVCILWRSALWEAKSHLTPSVPLILLLPPSGSLELLHLATPTTKLYKLPFTHNDNCIVVGSSFGWLVTMEYSTYAVELVNPITRDHISLPPAISFANFRKCPYQTARPFELVTYKIVLSDIPSPTCIAMAIHGPKRNLSFCRLGDRKWTAFPVIEQFWCYQDVIYYKGQFYAVTQGEAIVACVLDPIPKVIEVAPIPIGARLNKKYFLESSGNLLMAVRYYDYDEDATINFELYKLDMNGTLELLTSWDDHTLFSGNGSSVILSAHEAHGCKPNSIYFLDDNWDWYIEESVCRGAGVYTLGGYEIHPLYFPWPLPWEVMKSIRSIFHGRCLFTGLYQLLGSYKFVVTLSIFQ